MRAGDRVSVQGSIPHSYFHPLADVVTVGPVRAKVRLCCDGTEWRIPHDDLEVRPNTGMLNDLFVVIPCSSQKQPVPAPAAEFYTGPYFTACLAAARTLTVDRNIAVLSAKHGLLWLDDVVEPYDVKMGDPGSIDVRRFAATCHERGVYAHIFGPWRVVVFGGAAYREMAATFFQTARYPLAGLAGIGEHLHVLKEIAETGVLPNA